MRYTDTHEWIRAEGHLAVVGITQFAQKELGDIVHVELPKVGRTVKVGDEVVVLESTKTAVDVYAPISGTITQVNELLKDASDLVNNSPEDKGWLFKIQIEKMEELESLLDETEYQTLIAKQK